MGEGLMPSPSVLARQRRQALRTQAEDVAREVAQDAIDQETEGAEAVIETVHGNLRSTTDPNLTQFYQTVYGLHIQFQKRHLDIMELLSHDDRQWQTVRRVALDVINEEWKALEAFLHQSIAGTKAIDTTKKEKKDDGKRKEPAA
jgi:hypothetical protein